MILASRVNYRKMKKVYNIFISNSIAIITLNRATIFQTIINTKEELEKFKGVLSTHQLATNKLSFKLWTVL